MNTIVAIEKELIKYINKMMFKNFDSQPQKTNNVNKKIIKQKQPV